MNETCSVCGLAARTALEQQILAGASIRSLARRYHLGRDTIAHHKSSHMTLAPKVALPPPLAMASPAATPEPEPVRTVPNETTVCYRCRRADGWFSNWRGFPQCNYCGHEWEPWP
jgi:hypothetical protein